MSQNNTEHRIHNRENSPYQVSKPCVKLYEKKKFIKEAEFLNLIVMIFTDM
jgi:hypothetical protein